MEFASSWLDEVDKKRQGKAPSTATKWQEDLKLPTSVNVA